MKNFVRKDVNKKIKFDSKLIIPKKIILFKNIKKKNLPTIEKSIIKATKTFMNLATSKNITYKA